MAFGEKKREEQGTIVPSQLSPTSSQKPTLAGISDQTSEQPKRVTVAGIAPPGPGSDRPPPMSQQEREEFTDGMASTEPPPLSRDAARRSSHTRGTQASLSGLIEVPPHDPVPDELVTQPQPFEAPVPSAFESDATLYGSEPPSFEAPEVDSPSSRRTQEKEVESCEKITRPEILKTPEAREGYKTVPGGGRNRMSGGREHAAAYVSPGTVPPSRGRSRTTAAIRVDRRVLNESRSHETEPSLRVRRQASFSPTWPKDQPGAPSAKRLALIVVSSAVVAGFSVWFVLKPADPSAVGPSRVVPMSQSNSVNVTQAPSPAARALLEKSAVDATAQPEAVEEPVHEAVASPAPTRPAPPSPRATAAPKPARAQRPSKITPQVTKKEVAPAPIASEATGVPPKSQKPEEPWLD
jgi:hypothetical protein